MSHFRSSKSAKQPKMVSYREFREIQRQKEMAHQGPGSTEYLKPFGSDAKGKTDFGSKYKFVPDSNPPPGLYDIEKAETLTKPRTKFMAVTTKEKKMDVTMLENKHNPDAGEYNATKPFGHGLKKVNFGSKYEFKPDKNPGPGEYDIEKAKLATQRKVPAATIKQHPQFPVY